MRNNLIGYLIEALDPAERLSMEEQLGRDPRLRQELHLIERSLEPLRADHGHYDPPLGLAQRTCEYVAAHAATTASSSGVSSAAAISRSRWTLADIVVAAGIVFAASMLFFPALNHSRFNAQLLNCRNNLRQLGVALTQYSTRHGDVFPTISTRGKFGTAGIYGPKLVNSGCLTDSSALVCPASSLACEAHCFRVPTLDEVQQAEDAPLAELQRKMGGSYAYNLGYMSKGHYRPTKNLSRPTFALMADAPSAELSPRVSANHGGRGQNVLFEDGHVAYLTSCKAGDCGDDIFLNDEGDVAAGSHWNDAVVGASFARPVLWPIDE